MIGIPTLTAGGSAGGAQVQGIGFAIPSNLARDIAQQIITLGSVTNSHRAAIGTQFGAVTGQDGNPAGTGIVTVTSGGPADRAGLRAGDVIRTAGGRRYLTRGPSPESGRRPPRGSAHPLGRARRPGADRQANPGRAPRQLSARPGRASAGPHIGRKRHR